MSQLRPRLSHAWPDAAQRQLLQAALLPDRTAALWPSIAAWLDVDAAPPATARLFPLLGYALTNAGVADARVERMQAMATETGAKNAHALGHAAELVEALAEAGIPTVVLKGPALALTAYPDPSLRPMGDMDLLVPTRSAEQALAIGRAHGWAPRGHASAAWRRQVPDIHTFAADWCQVDLHWHVFHDFGGEVDDAELWRAAVPLRMAGAETLRLSATDELLHVCIHGVRWARTPGIRWVADATLLARSEPIDWDRLVRSAARRRFVLRARMTLGYLRRYFGVEVPDEALARLRALPVTPAERLEYVATSRPPGPLRRLPQQWSHFVRSSSRDDPAAVTGFASYLADAWELPGVAALPGAVVARLYRHWLRGSSTETGR